MYTTGLALSVLTLLTSAVNAAPQDSTVTDATLEARAANNFKIHVWNNCPFQKQVALYQVTGAFKMVQMSKPTNIASKKSLTIPAPYKALGMRLSGHAEWGTDAQWNVQALFEFGYSEYMGQDGTAYNLSVMEGSDKDIGIGAYPVPNGKGSKQCPSKTCFPWNCPLSQGWTNPDQVKDGSPADTVCYKGKTDFKVVFCP
ncbi:hypothetical protein HII31_08213 [Pseudocercospora fuligena]|uniref:Uncharacterized protein n=1 Tax=Pseudocercospora fuligena TaxID=685502 RepID=A0A8H6VJQ3_9PEZI|nr:hypothetical protein HII31_08213 [Pseudocercospora fuligena]